MHKITLLPGDGIGPVIAGKNIANPAALMLSGALMLRHINKTAVGDRLESAVIDLISEGMSGQLILAVMREPLNLQKRFP